MQLESLKNGKFDALEKSEMNHILGGALEDRPSSNQTVEVRDKDCKITSCTTRKDFHKDVSTQNPDGSWNKKIEVIWGPWLAC